MSNVVLTIDRAKWLRGEGGWASRLFRPSDGKMCCLGFYSLVCGLTKEEIADASDLTDIFDKPPELRQLQQSELDVKLMDVNDMDILNLPLPFTTSLEAFTTEAERETIIKRLFAEHGVEVVFIG